VFVPVPFKGILITNFSVLLQAIHWVAIKYIYILHPGITGLQILFAESLVASIVTHLYVSKDLKNAMWDSLEEGSLKLIAFRSFTELILRGCMYSSMAYFTLTTFAVFNNLSPLLTLLFAVAILKENVTCFDYTTVLLGFGAVSIITIGMTQG
jgi:drug/metabolite transporter (DMT)-like permease